MTITFNNIKCLTFDIDGVLTDGSVTVDERGHEYKSFRLTELDALFSLKQKGYILTAITGENSPITDVFRKRIPWDEFLSGCKDKLDGLLFLEQKFNLVPDEILYIGDGKYDIPALVHAGVGVCPANAISDAKKAADIVLNGYGGKDCLEELRSMLSLNDQRKEDSL